MLSNLRGIYNPQPEEHLQNIPQLRCGHGPHEVHTSLSKLLEERIIVGNLYWEALWVDDKLADRSRSVLQTALDTIAVVVRESEAEIRIK